MHELVEVESPPASPAFPGVLAQKSSPKRRIESTCFYCSVELVRTDDQSEPRAKTIDHVVPRYALKNAGWLFTNEWHSLNRVPCCPACNIAKGNTLPHVWCRQLTDPTAKARLYNRLVALGIPADALMQAVS